MNFSELYKCWRFAENVAHPHNVKLHKSIHNDICEMLPSPSRGEEKYNEIRRFHNYMEDILNNNKKTSTMIKELVEEIDRLKEA
tara:strand:+ start:5 stop:256 length:252 start_codon:yes stop_codon:yes gene_type:complete